MHQVLEALKEMKLVGIEVLTSNAREMNPETALIGVTLQKFFGNGLQNQIEGRKNPGTVFAVYTHYETDVQGEYTYFLGEEVSVFECIPPGFKTLTIPAQMYAKFTSNPGLMPDVCIEMWQNIWQMNTAILGGQRAYIADFEVYDGRSADPQKAVVDIYIGIQN